MIYSKPELTVILLYAEQVICLSLTGGTEPMSQGDLEDITIDDPFTM